MGGLERKIKPAALATALAKNPQPHRHASATGPIIPGKPLSSLPSKWPTPAYRAKLEARRQRRAVP